MNDDESSLNESNEKKATRTVHKERLRGREGRARNKVYIC